MFNFHKSLVVTLILYQHAVFSKKTQPIPATDLALALAMIRQGLPFKTVSEKTGISRPTYFRLKKSVRDLEPQTR